MLIFSLVKFKLTGTYRAQFKVRHSYASIDLH